MIMNNCFCHFRYSRRILWLQVGRTNNNPKVVAGFFLQCLREIKGVPRCVRTDRGTENSEIAKWQMAFRWNHQDDMAGEHSFLMGSSPANQRIERWWLSNRQGGGQFWIAFMKDLQDTGIFSSANHLQV
ncbi:uncharacterized protein LOC134694398 [Mytilus trossulus]|uniref:uncharacterized protein LOC134694396 n=1 Tax=Mytilus trossulus TaxID=6551 RepID=UPI00300531AC